MQRVLILMLAMGATGFSGCSTAGKTQRRPGASTPSVVYNGVDQDAINARANDLQSRGISRDGAVAKATREAERQAWSVDSTEEARYERARRAYQQQQDELNAGLRKLAEERK